MSLNIFPSLTTGRPDRHRCNHREGEPHMEERDAGDGVFSHLHPDFTRRPAVGLPSAWRSYVCHRLWAGAWDRVPHQRVCRPQQQEERSRQCQSGHTYVHTLWSTLHTRAITIHTCTLCGETNVYIQIYIYINLSNTGIPNAVSCSSVFS